MANCKEASSLEAYEIEGLKKTNQTLDISRLKRAVDTRSTTGWQNGVQPCAALSIVVVTEACELCSTCSGPKPGASPGFSTSWLFNGCNEEFDNQTARTTLPDRVGISQAK